jgi:glycosyltransferase involved in cell wall biosynthesis
MKADYSNSILIIPAYNEEASIAMTVNEVRQHLPGLEVLVISDGSEDRTAEIARAAGATVLDLPCNLGVGSAVQAGFRYAYEQGYHFLIRCDGDGQHPSAEVPKLIEAMNTSGVDMVIGSRFLGRREYTGTFLRNCGIWLLAASLSVTCRKRVTDPTSGFQMMNRQLMNYFAASYPAEYPEPEALARLRRQGYDFAEVPVTFRERQGGQSSIAGWGAPYVLVKICLALLVDRGRQVDRRYAKFNRTGKE